MRIRSKVTMTIPKTMVDKVDRQRGLIPRSRYLEIAILEFLRKKEKRLTTLSMGKSKPHLPDEVQTQ